NSDRLGRIFPRLREFVTRKPGIGAGVDPPKRSRRPPCRRKYFGGKHRSESRAAAVGFTNESSSANGRSSHCSARLATGLAQAGFGKVSRDPAVGIWRVAARMGRQLPSG